MSVLPSLPEIKYPCGFAIYEYTNIFGNIGRCMINLPSDFTFLYNKITYP